MTNLVAILNDETAVSAGIASRVLGVKARTVLEWAKRGEIPSVRIGRAVRFPTKFLRQQVLVRDDGKATPAD